MKKTKKPWTFRSFLRNFDFFGESFTFRYKDENKLSTVLSGIICIIFYIIGFVYVVINFIPFYNRKIFTLQYYAMHSNNSDHTDDINLEDNKTSFAFGLTNDDNKAEEYKLYELFNINIKYILKENRAKKENKTIIKYPCKQMDNNYNNINNILVKSSINEFYCLNKKDLNESPIGIYTDEKFSYYEISVEAKYKDKQHYAEIEDYLTKYDCKLQFYYTDIITDLNNFNEPFSYIVNSMFLQLNPTLFQKKNIFYMNYHLNNETQIFHFNTKMAEEIPRKETGLSRTEDYSLYKGLNRSLTKPEDESYYAKIYIRADNRKIIIKRIYQDIMEFYADVSGLLISLFWIFGLIFAYYDQIKANHSISKKLFYFEGITDNKFPEFRKLKELILTNQEFEKNIEKTIINLPEGNSSTYRRASTRRNNFIRRDSNSTFNTNIDAKDKKLINYSDYNLFEMIGSFKLFHCKTKKFESKVSLFKQSKKMIDDKLDIIFYIRSMILFELINKIYLENKTVVNFLSRPIIYIKDLKEINQNSENEINYLETNISNEMNDKIQKEKIDEKDPVEVLKYFKDELYKSAYRLDSTKLSEKISKLVINPKKTKVDELLIDLLLKQFKGIK